MDFICSYEEKFFKCTKTCQNRFCEEHELKLKNIRKQQLEKAKMNGKGERMCEYILTYNKNGNHQTCDSATSDIRNKFCFEHHKMMKNRGFSQNKSINKENDKEENPKEEIKYMDKDKPNVVYEIKLNSKRNTNSYANCVKNKNILEEFKKQLTEEDTKKEDTKKEDTKKEDTKKEDTKKEDTKKEDTKKEDTKKEDTKKEDTKKEDTKKEDTKKEDTKKEDTKKEDTKKEDTKKEDTKKEDTKNVNVSVKSFSSKASTPENWEDNLKENENKNKNLIKLDVSEYESLIHMEDPRKLCSQFLEDEEEEWLNPTTDKVYVKQVSSDPIRKYIETRCGFCNYNLVDFNFADSDYERCIWCYKISFRYNTDPYSHFSPYLGTYCPENELTINQQNKMEYYEENQPLNTNQKESMFCYNPEDCFQNAVKAVRGYKNLLDQGIKPIKIGKKNLIGLRWISSSEDELIDVRNYLP